MADKKKIIIVDDDKAVLESLEKLLVLSGFEALSTCDPRDAVSKIKAFKPNIILLDLLMPHLGGLEICEILNADKDTQGIPIIVLSALDKEADIKKAYYLGVVDYITKPYDFQDLLRKINKAVFYKDERPGL